MTVASGLHDDAVFCEQLLDGVAVGCVKRGEVALYGLEHLVVQIVRQFAYPGIVPLFVLIVGGLIALRRLFAKPS